MRAQLFVLLEYVREGFTVCRLKDHLNILFTFAGKRGFTKKKIVLLIHQTGDFVNLYDF
jgi:hypothetical protein